MTTITTPGLGYDTEQRDRINARLGDLNTAIFETVIPLQEASTILSDALVAVKRAAKRAAVPEGYQTIEIGQDRGPTVEFTGRLLTSTSFETRGPKPLNILLEIFETQAGALIAVSSSVLAGGEGREDARVTVVPPQDDVQAMRFQVMEAFGYEVRARSMVRKLGWSLRMDVA